MFLGVYSHTEVVLSMRLIFYCEPPVQFMLYINHRGQRKKKITDVLEYFPSLYCFYRNQGLVFPHLKSDFTLKKETFTFHLQLNTGLTLALHGEVKWLIICGWIPQRFPFFQSQGQIILFCSVGSNYILP